MVEGCLKHVYIQQCLCYSMLRTNISQLGGEFVSDRKKKYRELINQLYLFHDDFMVLVFKDIPCVELFLSIIFHQYIHINHVFVQDDLRNLHGRAGILDIVAVDDEDNFYNIEVQNENEGANPKRARYHASLMDVHMIEKNTSWKDIPRSRVIFITRKDVLGYGLPMYHINRRIDENKEKFNDEQRVIYINGEKEEDTPLGRLIHDFKCTDPNDMYYEVLANRVKYFKEGEGEKEMCEIWDKIRKDGEARGKEIGKLENLQMLYNDGILTKEQFEKYTNDIQTSGAEFI